MNIDMCIESSHTAHLILDVDSIHIKNGLKGNVNIKL